MLLRNIWQESEQCVRRRADRSYLLVDTNKISTVKVNGLDNSFQTSLNIFNQEITGTGEHKIRIPAIQDGRDTIIVVGTSYSVSITLVFSLTNEEQTSDTIDYVPEIKYSSS